MIKGFAVERSVRSVRVKGAVAQSDLNQAKQQRSEQKNKIKSAFLQKENHLFLRFSTVILRVFNFLFQSHFITFDLTFPSVSLVKCYYKANYQLNSKYNTMLSQTAELTLLADIENKGICTTKPLKYYFEILFFWLKRNLDFKILVSCCKTWGNMLLIV